MSASRPPSIDPFGPTSNPRFYVPRETTETVLRELRRRLDLGARPVALTGPSGIGKTMLLRVLTLQLERRFRMVFVPYATLGPDDLAAWTLSLLGLEPDRTPVARLLREAAEGARRGAPLLIVIDDADAMPLETARTLGGWVRESDGALRVLVTAADGPRVGRFLAALDPATEEVRLSDAMEEPETARYVQARLAAARAPESVAARFDAATISRIHEESGGVPRRIHEAASRVLREPGSSDLVTRARAAHTLAVEEEEPPPLESADAGEHDLDLPASRLDHDEEDLPAPASASPPPAAGVPAQPEPARLPAAEPPRAAARAAPGAGRRPRPRRRIIRPASPGILGPLGIALLVAIAAVLVPLLTPSRIGREPPVVSVPATRAPGLPATPAPRTPARAITSPPPAARTGSAAPPEPATPPSTAAALAAGSGGAGPPATATGGPGSELAPPTGAEPEAPSPTPAEEPTGTTEPPPPVPSGSSVARAGAGVAPSPQAREQRERSVEGARPPSGASSRGSAAAAGPAQGAPPEPSAGPSGVGAEPPGTENARAPEASASAPAAPQAAGPAEAEAAGASPDAGASAPTETSEATARTAPVEAPGPSTAAQREVQTAIPPAAGTFPGGLPAEVPARPAPVRVHVNATPWAEIEVDGVVVGVTPLAGLPLLPGEHVFRARMPDGRVLERRLEIGPDARHVTFE